MNQNANQLLNFTYYIKPFECKCRSIALLYHLQLHVELQLSLIVKSMSHILALSQEIRIYGYVRI